MKRFYLFQGHLPDNEIKEEKKQEIFQGQERQIKPDRRPPEYFKFFGSFFRQVGTEPHRTYPAAESLAQQQPDTQGSQKDGKTGRMDHVILAAQDKPLQAHKCTDRQKSLNRSGPGNKDRCLAGSPEIELVKAVSRIEAEKCKTALYQGS